MTVENLIRSMEESAEKQASAAVVKGEADAHAILIAAQDDATRIRRECREATGRELRAERMRGVVTAREGVRQILAATRAELFSAAFLEAEKRLSTARCEDWYPECLGRLIDEAWERLGERTMVLHADPRDVPLCGTIITEKGYPCRVEGDIATSGGVIAESDDGKVRVVNTFEERLIRAKEILGVEIGKVLTGE